MFYVGNSKVCTILVQIILRITIKHMQTNVKCIHKYLEIAGKCLETLKQILKKNSYTINHTVAIREWLKLYGREFHSHNFLYTSCWLIKTCYIQSFEWVWLFSSIRIDVWPWCSYRQHKWPFIIYHSWVSFIFVHVLILVFHYSSRIQMETDT